METLVATTDSTTLLVGFELARSSEIVDAYGRPVADITTYAVDDALRALVAPFDLRWSGGTTWYVALPTWASSTVRERVGRLEVDAGRLAELYWSAGPDEHWAPVGPATVRSAAVPWAGELPSWPSWAVGITAAGRVLDTVADQLATLVPDVRLRDTGPRSLSAIVPLPNPDHDPVPRVLARLREQQPGIESLDTLPLWQPPDAVDGCFPLPGVQAAWLAARPGTLDDGGIVRGMLVPAC